MVFDIGLRSWYYIQIMTDAPTPHSYSLGTKILVIIGFIATVFLIIFLFYKAFALFPNVLSSLSATSNKIHSYDPQSSFALTPSKEVASVGDIITLSIEKSRSNLAYTLTPSCATGTVLARIETNESLSKLPCNEATLVTNVKEPIQIRIQESTERATDVLFTATAYKDTKAIGIGTTTVRVMNAETDKEATSGDISKPAKPDVSSPKEENVTSPVTVSPTPIPKPKVTYAYPTSNPNGISDLMVTTTGVGRLVNGNFVKTSEFDVDQHNAIKVMVKNVGTKTSKSWKIRTILPSGETYTSDTQNALKPKEYVEFTIGFFLDKDKSPVTVTSTVLVDDANSKNDTSKKSVTVQD